MDIYAVTWNIKAGRNPDGSYPPKRNENLKRIAEKIAGCDASIACLQEVDLGTIRSGRINQAAFIADRLSELTGERWHYDYISSIKMMMGSYGNAIISRFPLTTVLQQPLSKKYSAENRSFILTRMDFYGGCLFIGNFHLGLKGDQPIQAAKIKQVLYSHEFNRGKLLIGGDLNQSEGEAAYNIMRKNKFAMEDSGPSGIGTLKREGVKSVKADFWFCRGVSMDTSRSMVIDSDISDHMPVMIYLSDL